MEERKYTNIESVFLDINKKLPNSEDERNKYVDSFKEIFFRFLQEMKLSNPLFKSLAKIIYSDSSANLIKIDKVDEFEVNLSMKLPQELNQKLTIAHSTHAGYVELKTHLRSLEKHPKWDLLYSPIAEWMDSEGFLLQDMFREWMSSVIKETLSRLTSNGENAALEDRGTNYSLKLLENGLTLHVVNENSGIEFNVKLVPSFHIEDPFWPPNIKEKISTTNFKQNRWFVIARAPNKNSNRSWTPSFPLQEAKLLYVHNNTKILLKFVKQFREVNSMPYLSTTIINMLFIMESSRKPTNFWQKPVSFLLMHMLKQLLEVFTAGSLRSYWSPKHNLLSKIPFQQKQDCASKLNTIISDIDMNCRSHPEILNKYFLNIDSTTLSSEIA